VVSVHWIKSIFGRTLPVLLREPLFHFLLLGGALYLLYAGFGNNFSTTSQKQIIVDDARLSLLAQRFQRTWMRPPTRTELAGLADDFVKDKIIYREALALGLDKDDLVIRRRMRQEMEFLNADMYEQQPTDSQLQAYLHAHPDDFRQPGRCWNSYKEGRQRRQSGRH